MVGRDGSLHLPPDVLAAARRAAWCGVAAAARTAGAAGARARGARRERDGGRSRGTGRRAARPGRRGRQHGLMSVAVTVARRRSRSSRASRGPDARGHRTRPAPARRRCCGRWPGWSGRPAAAVTVGGVALRDRDHAVAEEVVLSRRTTGSPPILTAGENVQVALVACGVKPPEARRRTAESLERWAWPSRPTSWSRSSPAASSSAPRSPAGWPCAAGAARRRGDQRARRAEPAAGPRPAAGRGRRGAAVVFATHDPEAAAACDRELHLSDGVAQLVR